MALEEGIVTRTAGDTAFITTRRTTACEGCSERHVCHSMGNVKEIEIEVANPIAAKPGDTVMVAFKTSQLVTLSFMLYVFPIIAMVIGAVFGDSVAGNFGGDPSIFAAVFGFLFFGIAMARHCHGRHQIKRQPGQKDRPIPAGHHRDKEKRPAQGVGKFIRVYHVRAIAPLSGNSNTCQF